HTPRESRGAAGVPQESAESAEPRAGWEPPAPLGPAGHAPAFPVATLLGWLADFVKAEATATQTPPDLAGMLVLSALAAAAGGLAEVELRPRWRAPLNTFSGPPLPRAT